MRDSDGTLIVARRPLSGGTALTEKLALSLHKPCLVVDPDGTDGVAGVLGWMEHHGIATLNVAGPRQRPGNNAYDDARRFLYVLLRSS